MSPITAVPVAPGADDARRFRMNPATERVLRALLTAPGRPLSATDVGRAAGMAPHAVHGILDALEDCGWLAGSPEYGTPYVPGWPRWRGYRLTPGGAAVTSRLLGHGAGPAPAPTPPRRRRAVPAVLAGVLVPAALLALTLPPAGTGTPAPTEVRTVSAAVASGTGMLVAPRLSVHADGLRDRADRAARADRTGR